MHTTRRCRARLTAALVLATSLGAAAGASPVLATTSGPPGFPPSDGSNVSGWRATAPIFTEVTRASAPSEAAAIVRSLGYTPDSTRHYKPWAKLRVLVATATGSASGNNQQAFFFVGRRFIGTATSVPTGSLAYVGQSSTVVRLSYGVFGPGSGDCCPTSHRTVRFRWNGKRLVALDRIP